MGKLPTTLLRRPNILLLSPASSTSTSLSLSPAPPIQQMQKTQVRHATFVPRPRRPYHFTQLVQLSDGSTFTVRTTSPTALYKSGKDSRNHILWQPSDKTLKNVEVDEAGKLAAFRERFGRGWEGEEGASPSSLSDAVEEATVAEGKQPGEVVNDKAEEIRAVGEEQFDSLMDLISSYAKEDPSLKGGKSAKETAKAESKKKK